MMKKMCIIACALLVASLNAAMSGRGSAVTSLNPLYKTAGSAVDRRSAGQYNPLAGTIDNAMSAQPVLAAQQSSVDEPRRLSDEDLEKIIQTVEGSRPVGWKNRLVGVGPYQFQDGVVETLRYLGSQFNMVAALVMQGAFADALAEFLKIPPLDAKLRATLQSYHERVLYNLVVLVELPHFHLIIENGSRQYGRVLSLVESGDFVGAAREFLSRNWVKMPSRVETQQYIEIANAFIRAFADFSTHGVGRGISASILAQLQEAAQRGPKLEKSFEKLKSLTAEQQSRIQTLLAQRSELEEQEHRMASKNSSVVNDPRYIQRISAIEGALMKNRQALKAAGYDDPRDELRIL